MTAIPDKCYLRRSGEAGQTKLKHSAVCIMGMGALGTVLANHMVRAGVGHSANRGSRLCGASNLQRQMLYDEEDVKRLSEGGSR